MRQTTYLISIVKVGKAIPVKGCGGSSKLPHFLDNQLIDGGEVVNFPLPPERFMVLISVRGRVDPRAIVLLEGFIL
jgi:hypothetical protein